MSTDPKSAKKTNNLTVFLRFQDLHVKKMLVKCGEIYYRCQFHQHFMLVFFVRKCIVQLFSSYSLAFIFWRKRFGTKSSFTMLMKFTPGGQFHQYFTCSQTVSLFLHFWDLHEQKLLIERWWNWPQVWCIEGLLGQLWWKPLPNDHTGRGSLHQGWPSPRSWPWIYNYDEGKKFINDLNILNQARCHSVLKKHTKWTIIFVIIVLSHKSLSGWTHIIFFLTRGVLIWKIITFFFIKMPTHAFLEIFQNLVVWYQAQNFFLITHFII